MPRNGSSVYSLPAGNPVIPGTVIATTWANTTLTDIATALTNSLSTDGSTASVSLAGKTMSGGTFSAPSVTGILALTGGQIAFPAVQVPSANVNTLDDYEEGTWTPAITFATPGNLAVTYGGRAGTYTKVGNVVSFACTLVTSSFTHTTASGTVQITGFPITMISGSSFGLSWQQVVGLSAAGFTFVFPFILDSGGTPLIRMSASNIGASSANLATGNLPTGGSYTFSFSGFVFSNA